MPKRGKAATRQARQRRSQQRSVTPPRVASSAAETTAGAAGARSTANAATLPASGTSSAPAVNRSRSDRLWRPEGGSQLSERALAEYHYVGRDLRNIGRAAALMAAVLLAAIVVVRILGVGPG